MSRLDDAKKIIDELADDGLECELLELEEYLGRKITKLFEEDDDDE